MTEEETRHAESGHRQLHEDLEHQSRMSYLVEREELAKFALLKPRLFKDGDRWCVEYGEIVGYGDTPQTAIWDWNQAWL